MRSYRVSVPSAFLSLSFAISSVSSSSRPRSHRHHRLRGIIPGLLGDPLQLTNSSTSAPTRNYHSLGCFVDGSPHLLPDHKFTNVANEPDSCVQSCADRGFKFAGLQFGIQCYCGNSFVPSTSDSQAVGKLVPDTECAMTCSGNPTLNCGGDGRVQVYTMYEGSREQHPSAERISLSATDTPGKYVVAHFMVGNTYPYSVQDWLVDIRAAAAVGIDAFALNVGRDPWQPDRVRDAYAAAQASGTGFRLFFSFDVTSLPCATQSDANQLRQYISTYAGHSNQLQDLQGRAIVSTFAGEYCTFGRGNVNDGWQYAVKEGLPPTVFIPAFFVDPQTFKNYPVMDGDFHWNGAWPMGNYDISFSTDTQHISGLQAMQNGVQKAYMAAVSPWFFTHYGPDTYNKNWIYKSDNHLWTQRWDILISRRTQIALAEIITWNDYGESHYIGRIAGDQPMSQAWVNGFDHQGWLELSQYYVKAFKSGTYPPVLQDRVYFWARPHSKNDYAPDPVPKPRNWEWTDDFLWVVVLAKAPCTLILTSGSNSAQYDVVGTGARRYKVPSAVGRVSARLIRNGVSMFYWSPNGFTFTNNPPSYNFNAYVAAGP